MIKHPDPTTCQECGDKLEKAKPELGLCWGCYEAQWMGTTLGWDRKCEFWKINQVKREQEWNDAT